MPMFFPLLLAPVILQRVPKVDDQAAYSMQALIDLGGDDDVKFSGTFTEKVRSVVGDTFTTNVVTKIHVELMGVIRESRSIESDRVERIDGTLLSPSMVDSTVLFATPRVDRLRAVYLPSSPVETGATWWRTEGRNDALKAPAFSSFMKFVGEEKIGARDVWKVSLDANEVDDEHPAHVKGMLWLDKANLSLVKGQWAIEGFTYSENAAPSKARLELTLIEAAVKSGA